MGKYSRAIEKLESFNNGRKNYILKNPERNVDVKRFDEFTKDIELAIEAMKILEEFSKRNFKSKKENEES